MNRAIPAAAAVLAVTLVAACGSDGGGKKSGSSAPVSSAPASAPSQSVMASAEATVPTTAPPASGDTGDQLDPAVQEFVTEFKTLQQTLEAYWAQKINGYQAPSRTIVFGGKSDDPSSFPTCGGQQVSADNGFYCPPDNTVILDADWMYGEYQEVGDSFLYVVLAHEYGHSAQANLADADKPAAADVEIQADCFSGAFLQEELAAGNIQEEEGDEQEINSTLSSAAGDYGTTDAHGTLASRALAFEHGRKGGASGCLTVDEYRT